MFLTIYPTCHNLCGSILVLKAHCFRRRVWPSTFSTSSCGRLLSQSTSINWRPPAEYVGFQRGADGRRTVSTAVALRRRPQAEYDSRQHLTVDDRGDDSPSILIRHDCDEHVTVIPEDRLLSHFRAKRNKQISVVDIIPLEKYEHSVTAAAASYVHRECLRIFVWSANHCQTLIHAAVYRPSRSKYYKFVSVLQFNASLHQLFHACMTPLWNSRRK
jgi:hypothetical protein